MTPAWIPLNPVGDPNSMARSTPRTIMATATRIPLLKDGDRLDADEFERRYEASPHIKRAELIEGVVYVASPVRDIQHVEPQGLFVTWLGTYRAGTPGVRSGGAGTVRLDVKNVYEPDAMLMIDPGVGDRSTSTQATSREAQSWSSRFPPAPFVSTSVPSSRFIDVSASVSISYGEPSTLRSTGSPCGTVNMSQLYQERTG
jgi:hypothetical protein